MHNCPVSRRRLLTLSAGAIAAGLLGIGQAQHETIRLGFVLPLRTGQVPSSSNTQELAGEAAYKGAIMGGEDYGVAAGLEGKNLEVVVSSAPGEAAVLRAAERLATTEEVLALIGGFDEVQALALSAVAEDRKLLFFNIGSASDVLRRKVCNRYTFHVEASATMYLNALADWFTKTGLRRWLFVYPETEEGDALYRRAQEALSQGLGGASQAGAVMVPEVPIYYEAVEAIKRAEPEVVLLLLDWQSQLDFFGYYEAAGLEYVITGFPYPVTQTRDFFIFSKEVAPHGASGYRAALWEATLVAHGARQLNERFFERWGVPMDPPAWAAYQSVKILSEAIPAVDTLSSVKLAEYLESSRARFDIQKGVRASFRPLDHQLDQPLYLVKGNRTAERPLAMADLVSELPTNTLGSDPVQGSRRHGELQGKRGCNP
jgi:ABC-type branched-subunit amino acid transport system substrate-binding protein